MGTFSIISDAAPVVVYNYCFKGLWDMNDNIHNCPTPCGSVTYIDPSGNTTTISGISSSDPTLTIEAQSIVSTTGVLEVACPTI